MLEKPALPNEKIRACVQEHFAVQVQELEFLPIGNDATAWAYRVSAPQADYFLKVKSGPLKESSLTIPRYLNELGLRQVIAPIPAQSGLLHHPLDGYSLILYPLIAGSTGMQAGLSPKLRHELGSLLRQLPSLSLPVALTAQLRQENFAPPWIPMVARLQETIYQDDLRSPEAQQLASFWRTKENEIKALVTRAQVTGHKLRAAELDFVLCHGDFHDANLLIDPSGCLFIVDWDEILLSPKERDLFFITDHAGDTNHIQEPQARWFFEGYGETHIHPLALQYYQDEWTIQEIGDFGERILLR